MKAFVVCALFALAASTYGASAIPRIIGGQEVPVEKVPYTVSIEFEGEHVCGGVILSENRVLATAGCVSGAKPYQIKVRVGTTELEKGGQLLPAEAFIIHPEFDIKRKDYDVSVIVTKNKFTFNEQVQAVKLPEAGQKFTGVATISGFGSIEPFIPEMYDKLIAAQLTIQTTEECLKTLSPWFNERMVCAGDVGKDACFGDFGVPLVQDGVLIGLNSWGTGCTIKGRPRAFSNVPAYIDFITDAL